MSRIRHSPVVLFLEILSFLGILFAVGTLVRDAGTQYEQRISSAWLLLTSKSLGEGGKGKALEFLNRDKSYFPRVICRSISLPPPLCDERQSFARLDLASSADENAVIISSSNLAGADFSFAKLSGIEFRDANLAQANFSGGELRNAVFFRSNIEGANFINANLSASHFVLNNDLERSRKARFRYANISDTVFAIDLETYMNLLCRQKDRFSNSRLVELIGDAIGAACEVSPSALVTTGTLGRLLSEKIWEGAGIGPDMFEESWVWSGHEPSGLPGKYRTFYVCDPAGFPPDVAKSRFFGFPGLNHCRKDGVR